MFDIFFISIFLMPLAVLLHLSLSFKYEYIFYFSPMNSMIGMPEASSLNLPITFLFVEIGTIFRIILLSNIFLSFQKSYTSSVSIS